MEALAAVVGARPPKALASVDEDDLSDLAHAVRDACDRQRAELREATDKALGQIPGLLRGPVRKVLFG